MVLLDSALEARHKSGNPVRVAIVGAGYMGRGIALQILSSVQGMEVVAISNRTLTEANRAYSQAGVDSVTPVRTVSELEIAIRKRQYAVSEDAELLCKADGIDAILEATGEVEFGTHIVKMAIQNGKHVVLMNAELDATVGPILKTHADSAGVILSNADGDEPGVAMNLHRFVRTIGFQPVMAGNIKGFLNNYRTPETQRGFAEKHHQKPKMITSFADGTKQSMECTVLANATGFRVAQRGMRGYEVEHVNDILSHLDHVELLAEGRVEFALGAKPGTGAFVVGYDENPVKQQYMQYFKMGDGPLYLFYTPFHLPHLQVPLTLARAVLFQDAAITPRGAPVCAVATVAKRDLTAGEKLDGIGGFLSFGMIENADVVSVEDLLPMGVSDDCVLLRDMKKDEAIRISDVRRPEGRLVDELLRNQDERFFKRAAV